jgi:hypothetical protein
MHITCTRGEQRLAKRRFGPLRRGITTGPVACSRAFSTDERCTMPHNNAQRVNTGLSYTLRGWPESHSKRR